MPMSCLEACTAIAKDRSDDIIVSTMTAMFAISRVSPSPLNISSVPLMGGASGIGLGLALSRPDRRIIILDGDASLLMELGSLATIAGQAPRKFLHFVFNNNRQFSGTGNLDRPAGESFDFAASALAAGYAGAVRISTLDELEKTFLNSDSEKVRRLSNSKLNQDNQEARIPRSQIFQTYNSSVWETRPDNFRRL